MTERVNKYDQTVFEFKGYFKSSPNDIQYRYVCADTEEDAYRKIKKYAKKLVRDGFDEFVWLYNPIVEISGVIA